MSTRRSLRFFHWCAFLTFRKLSKTWAYEVHVLLCYRGLIPFTVSRFLMTWWMLKERVHISESSCTVERNKQPKGSILVIYWKCTLMTFIVFFSVRICSHIDKTERFLFQSEYLNSEIKLSICGVLISFLHFKPTSIFSTL